MSKLAFATTTHVGMSCMPGMLSAIVVAIW